MLRHRPLVVVLAGAGAAVVVGGRAGPVAAVVGSAVAWVVIGRAEPPGARRAREEVRRDLPHLVDLLAATLRAGAAPGDGVAVVCAALPGAAADRLAGVPARLALGTDPVQVWESLADDPDLAPLGRTLARAQATGAPVVASVSTGSPTTWPSGARRGRGAGARRRRQGRAAARALPAAGLRAGRDRAARGRPAVHPRALTRVVARAACRPPGGRAHGPPQPGPAALAATGRGGRASTQDGRTARPGQGDRR